MRFHVTPAAPLLTSDDLAPPAGGAPRGKLQCEFCGCGLDQSGGVLKKGDRAKAYLALDDDLEKVRKELTDATKRADDLAAQLAQLKTATTNKPADEWP